MGLRDLPVLKDRLVSLVPRDRKDHPELLVPLVLQVQMELRELLVLRGRKDHPE